MSGERGDYCHCLVFLGGPAHFWDPRVCPETPHEHEWVEMERDPFEGGSSVIRCAGCLTYQAAASEPPPGPPNPPLRDPRWHRLMG